MNPKKLGLKKMKPPTRSPIIIDGAFVVYGNGRWLSADFDFEKKLFSISYKNLKYGSLWQYKFDRIAFTIDLWDFFEALGKSDESIINPNLYNYKWRNAFICYYFSHNYSFDPSEVIKFYKYMSYKDVVYVCRNCDLIKKTKEYLAFKKFMKRLGNLN